MGDDFPACRVAILHGDEDRAYLGLDPDERWLDLSKLSCRFILIQLYSALCKDCIEETRLLSDFFATVEADPSLKGRLKIIGLGVYDSNRAVVRFRNLHGVRYPLFSDRHGQIFECLGQSELPLAYLVRATNDGGWVIELIKRGYFRPDDRFLQTLRRAVARGETTD